MLALRLFTTRSCVRFSRTFPQSFYRLSHEDSKTKESAKFQVYDGALRARLRWVKILSLSSSTLFLAVTPSMYSKLMASGANGFAWAASSVLCLLALSTPVLLQVLTKGYVTALRFDPDTKIFEADTFDFLGRTRTTTFTRDDVAFPDLMGPLSNLTIKNKSHLIDVESITDTEAFDLLMKYDKPIDLMLGPDSESKDKEKDNEKDVAKQ